MAGRIGVLAPLADRNFRLLAIGNLTSLTGDGFFRVAVAIQVLAISGDSPGAIAAVAMTWAFGQMVALPLGGWAGDRFNRRLVMVCADVARGIVMGTIGLLAVTGNLQLWQMMTLGFLFGVGNGFFNPTAMAFVPDLVSHANLTQANSFLGVARPAMVYIVGPIVGAQIVGVGGPGLAFLLNAGTFLVSTVMLSLIRYERPPALRSSASPWSDVAESLRYVTRTRWAWPWLVGAGFSTLMFFGPFEVLFPSLLRLEFQMGEAEIANVISYVLTAGGLGAIVAGTALGQWDLPRRFITLLYIAEAVGTAGLAVMGVMQYTWHAVVGGAIAYTLFAVTDIVWTTTMQRYVPRAMLGRVASLDWLTSISLAPFGFAVAWLLEATVGLRTGLTAAGIVGAGVVLGMLLIPGTRDPERGVVKPVEAASGQA